MKDALQQVIEQTSTNGLWQVLFQARRDLRDAMRNGDEAAQAFHGRTIEQAEAELKTRNA